MTYSAKKYWYPQVRKFFRAVVQKFDLESFELEIFYGCCDNLNRFHEAKEILDKDGITFTTTSGQIKKHPATELERQGWMSFLAGMKQLKFTDAIQALEQPKKLGRPLR